MADPNKDKKAAPAPIIKKIKKAAHGHHGGAWKIAYADFVTAMMAFFLLLWLLTTTPSQTLSGVAEYFAPTTGLKDSMGIGFYGGKTPLQEGSSVSNFSHPPSIMYGVPHSGEEVRDPAQSVAASGDKTQPEKSKFEEMRENIMKTFIDNPELNQFKNNIFVVVTSEGLRINIVDQDRLPMFKPGSSTLEPQAQAIIKKISELIAKVPNRISISGHTDPSPSSKTGYTNWELSSDRANSSRRFLESTGYDKEKIYRVMGMSDRELLIPENPASPLNRRIAITLLYKSIAPFNEKPAPDIFFDGKRANTEKLLDIKSKEPPEPAKSAPSAPAAPPPAPKTEKNIKYLMKEVTP